MEAEKPKLQILISTINEKIQSLESIIKATNPLLGYIIVHQIYKYKETPDLLAFKDTLAKRSDIELITYEGKGLTISRNICLRKASAELVLIADDDVTYKPDILFKIIDAFEKSQCDVATFRIDTPEGYFLNRYRSYEFTHSQLSILKVSSIEIALRTRAIKDHNIIFDERFGLGSRYQSGEEAIFLKECLSKHLILKYIPITIATHPQFSTGTNWSNAAMAFGKGAMFKRLYGFMGVFFLLPFSVLKWKQYREHYTLFKFIQKNMASFLGL